MKTKKMMKVLVVMLLLSFPVITKAQPGGGGDDPGAPIDGGLSILLAAGAAYGVKKYRDGKKKQDDVEK